MFKKSTFYTWVSVAAAVGFLAACGDKTVPSDTAETQSEAKVEPSSQSTPAGAPAVKAYAFSLLAPAMDNATLVYGRIVIDQPSQTCPVLTGADNSTLVTHVRPMYPNGKTTSAEFPVTVCEAVLEPGVRYHNDALGIVLHETSLSVERVAVFGDSGCHNDKTCTGAQPSPNFKRLAGQSLLSSPQLILHMGDFNYRGTAGAISGKTYAYDAGDGGYGGPSCGYEDTYVSQNAMGSPRPDSWAAWQADFFDSTDGLLNQAPWVFARGNHELCSRAGPGWFYFLGPGSGLAGAGRAQMQCPYQGEYSNPPAKAVDHIAMIEPYMLGLKNFDVWVSDSANACDAQASNALTPVFQAQYQSLIDSVKQPTLMMTHRPLWGYQGAGNKNLDVMLQTALSKTSRKALPDEVFLSLAGHMHLFQSLTFDVKSNRAPQLIVGNSGVKLNKYPVSGPFTTTMDSEKAKGHIKDAFGFLNMTITDGGNWTGQLLAIDGEVLFDCGSASAREGDVCQKP